MNSADRQMRASHYRGGPRGEAEIDVAAGPGGGFGISESSSGGPRGCEPTVHPVAVVCNPLGSQIVGIAAK